MTKDEFRAKLRIYDPYWTDVATSVSSTWAAVVLWINPADINRYPAEAAYRIIDRIVPNAGFWALLLTIAALAKIVGLLLVMRHEWWGFSIILRKFGYSISVIWWMTLGLGALQAGFLILGFLPFLVSVRMMWMILMETAFPPL